MGLLDGLVGGAVGAGLITALNGLIEKHGGVRGLVDKFEKEGFGSTIKSWVGTGENEPISPDEVKQAVGTDELDELAQRAGMTREELAAKLSEILPKAVDKLTPNGTVT